MSGKVRSAAPVLAILVVVGAVASIARGGVHARDAHAERAQLSHDRHVPFIAGLSCPGGDPTPDRPAVLLVPGTGQVAADSWGDEARALGASGRTACLLDLPGRSQGDIRATAEAVADAVRALATTSAAPVAVVGHSQGGLDAAWAVLAHPDVATDVDRLVTLGTPWRGLAVDICGATCPLAVQQMRPGSEFLRSILGARWPGSVRVTSIAASDDGLVPPDSAITSALTAEPIVVQHECLGHAVGHAGLLRDPLVTALVQQALDGAQPTGDCSALRRAPMVSTHTGS